MPFSSKEKLKTLLYLKQSPELAMLRVIEQIKDEAEKTLEEQVKELTEKVGREAAAALDIAVTNLKTIHKGDSGYTPVKGRDYFTTSEINSFASYIQSRIRMPQDGVDGKDAPSMEEIKEATKELVKQQAEFFFKFDEKDLLQKLKLQFPKLELKGEDIVGKINALPITPDKQIDASHIKNLGRLIQKGKKGGGGDTVAAGTNITITESGGVKTISSSGGGSGGTWVSETPSGTKNNSNVTFTISSTPVTGSLLLQRNSGTLIPTSDYTLSGTTITFVNPPLETDVLHAHYMTSSSTTGTRLTMTGTVNGVNTIFTISSQPAFVVSDGVLYESTDSNGVVQWSYSSGTITMTLPPSSSIYGISSTTVLVGSKLSLIGAVNGVNTTYLVGIKPSYLVLDGLWYEETDTNGVVQWSYSAGTITTTLPPSSSAFGLA